MNPAEWAWLLAIPVVLPFVGAAAALLLARHRRAQATVSIAALSITLVAAFVICAMSMQMPVALNIGGWNAPLGITLVADRLSGLMLVVSVFVTTCVLIYSVSQGVHSPERDIPVTVYYPTFLILSAGVSNAFLTGDLFNLYVGFEILLVASFVLITLGATRDRLRSGATYVVVSVMSSAVFVIAIAMAYAACGTVNIAQLADRLQRIDPGVSLVIELMLLVAFGVKAAVFPLAAWLPDSYPTAPAPVTAVFAGLLTKVGVYAMIRTKTILFPSERLDNLLLVVGVATMVIGILGAIAQDDIKRLLSFTLVSHIGFMIWGLGLGTEMGIAAAIFYTGHHIIVQTALFLVSGLMERVGGSTSLTHLGSLLKAWPLLGALYLIPALNLAGIPPLSGFIGKLGLIEASVAVGSPMAWVSVAGGLGSSLLTLYAVIKAWNMAFWQPADKPLQSEPVPRTMTGATVALVVGSLLLTVFAGPLWQFASQAATALVERAPYLNVALPNPTGGHR